jgi:Chitobiase/beta-hexosaminidase C-terminal domain
MICRGLAARSALSALMLLALLHAPGVHAQPAPVLQRGYDANVSGATLTETTLTTSNVAPGGFGLVFKLAVDDNVMAQPLYVPNVTINGTAHNVVYVATMSDTLYAFDADVGGAPLWTRSLSAFENATPVPMAQFAFSGSQNVIGNDGILSTPVIDLSTNTLYAVACTLENSAMVYRLHAVDITTGVPRTGSGVVISGTYSTMTFAARTQWQRLSLVLSGNNVVFGFSAMESESTANLYSGWVMAYDKSSLAQTGIFATVTSGNGGAGVWQSGRPPAVDSSGNVYIFTGNGYNGTGYDGVHNFSESVLKLNPANGLSLVDWFTPSNWSQLDNGDADLSSAGPMLVPGTSLLVGGGKAGLLYVLNTGSLGKNTANDSGAVQKIPISSGEMHGGPVYWQRSAANGGPLMYDWGMNDTLKAFPFNGSTFATTPSAQGTLTNQIWPGGILTLSANGQTPGTGVVWATVSTSGDSNDSPPTPGALYAFDAGNVATALWNSNINAARDAYGSFAKLVPPLVANGRVYVATYSQQVAVYGLIGPPAAAPTFTPAPGTYNSAQSVTLASTTPGASFFYTTNGTTPTTNSTPYTGPIPVSSSTTIEAIAIASGFSASAVSSGAYVINLPPAAAPTFTPAAGTYNNAQSVALASTTPGASLFYTINGTTPTTNSTPYTGPIPVSSSMTIEAIAIASGFSSSPVSSATYTISTTATQVSLVSSANVDGFVNNGSAVPNGGLDNDGYAYSATLVGPSLTWNGNTYLFGAAGIVDAVSNTTVPLPAGSYTSLSLLGTGVNANQTNQTFTVTYSDGSATNFTQSLSDWFTPQNYAGESKALTMAYRVNTNGSLDNRTFYLYGYSFPLNSAKTPVSLTLPKTRNVIVLAIDLTPASGGGTQPAAAPTFTPAAGTYTSAQSVTLASTTPGASLFYTTNGTTPTTGSTPYTGPIAVGTSMTIEAIATASGFSQSPVSSAAYAINIAQPPAAAPTFNPAAGTYTSAQSVTLASTTPGATFFYTINGTTPTTGSTPYIGPIMVTSSMTIEAIATATGFSQSAVSSAAYTINIPVAAAPTFTPAAGTYTSAQSVTLASTTPGASLFYTTNGTTPTTGSTPYTGPIAVGSSMTIEAIATASGFSQSPVSSASYTINIAQPPAAAPTFTPAAGTYTTTQSVTLASTTPGASLFYTTNGTTPTTGSTPYTGPIAVGSSMTIEAIATANGFSQSPVSSATYTINSSTSATEVSLVGSANVDGIVNNGSAVPNRGLDNDGYAYSETLIGPSLTWNGNTYLFGAAGSADAVSNTTVSLPAGSFSTLSLLATGVNGNQRTQSFTVTYSDASTSTFKQSLSDWFTPQNYPGESKVLTMAYRINTNGSLDNRTFYLYGYSFALPAGKTPVSVKLPVNRNVVVLAIDLR